MEVKAQQSAYGPESPFMRQLVARLEALEKGRAEPARKRPTRSSTNSDASTPKQAPTDRTPKTLTLDIYGREDVVAADRLKPAYIAALVSASFHLVWIPTSKSVHRAPPMAHALRGGRARPHTSKSEERLIPRACAMRRRRGERGPSFPAARADKVAPPVLLNVVRPALARESSVS
ncbi:hypothetical protein HPB50_013743 [Hyalomma asiaticum]|uniref:Uncharacterized protein n=1 Tax=Hyalomma asiaticum TaxID=266040 RepID=A0ACB7SKP9_HYAAI|nr:hypothetical protein HPB50_013743 [Hyalomma asiaticum]